MTDRDDYDKMRLALERLTVAARAVVNTEGWGKHKNEDWSATEPQLWELAQAWDIARRVLAGEL